MSSLWYPRIIRKHYFKWLIWSKFYGIIMLKMWIIIIIIKPRVITKGDQRKRNSAKYFGILLKYPRIAAERKIIIKSGY